MNANFEIGKKYGNDLTIEVIKRTDKTVLIKTLTWGEKRVKINCFQNAAGGITEMIFFKAWVIDAAEEFNKEEATRISYERAYYS